MRLRRRKPELTVRMLWKNGEIKGLSLTLGRRFVGYIPMHADGSLCCLASGVVVEHGGDYENAERRSAGEYTRLPGPSSVPHVTPFGTKP